MYVTLQIIYKSAVSGSNILQRGSFPLKGRKPEKIAIEWFREIEREMHVDCIEQVLCNGEDITPIVKDMDTSISLPKRSSTEQMHEKRSNS
jgi:hypothetical protein